MNNIIFTNAKIATMTTKGPHAVMPYGLIEHGAIAIENGYVAWCGPEEKITPRYKDWRTENQKGRLITPALIDCHTHIVHGGNRANEFEMRLTGKSYAEIAKAGGGIVSTVKATREASKEELFLTARRRVKALIAEGVSTIEIKSGYGLDIQTEVKMLRIARDIGKQLPVRVLTTFLGAHALPAEYKDRPDAYIDHVCIPALQSAHSEELVDAVDGFCESIGFTPAQIQRIFQKAQELDLPVKLHVEQLSNMNGAALAAKYGALSADHLEYIDDAGIAAMAKSGTAAVLLPGAFYYLRETQIPPVQALRNAGVPIAIATDNNPGSSPLTSLLLTMNMACTLFHMTPEETLAGVTRNAARALGLNDTGIIAKGKRADLAIWDAEHPAELSYRIGFNPLHKRIFGGQAL